MGRERTRVLAVRSDDPVLSVIGPVGLATSVGTALLVDLGDQLGSNGGRSLADVSVDGPRLDEIEPARRGVAVMRGGGIAAVEAHALVTALSTQWPWVVVRVRDGGWRGPTVPVRALLPGWLAPSDDWPSVWQQVLGGVTPPGPGPVLPPVGSGSIRRILAGVAPPPGRWLRAWRAVWEMPWG